MKDLAYGFCINASLICIYLLLISIPSRTPHTHNLKSAIPRPIHSEQKLDVHRISNPAAIQSTPLYLMTANEPPDAAPTLPAQFVCQEMVDADAPTGLLKAVEALNDTVRSY